MPSRMRTSGTPREKQMPQSIYFPLLAAFVTLFVSAVATGEDPAAKKDVPSEAQIRDLVSHLRSDDFATCKFPQGI